MPHRCESTAALPSTTITSSTGVMRRRSRKNGDSPQPRTAPQRRLKAGQAHMKCPVGIDAPRLRPGVIVDASRPVVQQLGGRKADSTTIAQ
jgi:hypothetical protein